MQGKWYRCIDEQLHAFTIAKYLAIAKLYVLAHMLYSVDKETLHEKKQKEFNIQQPCRFCPTGVRVIYFSIDTNMQHCM